MTCKDCLHCEACTDMLENLGYTVDGDGCDADKRCKCFADRSEWVHLPCKVGDKVYQTDGIRIYESTIHMIYCTENISFDERAIGKSIFLTREEAEKALKGGAER